MGPPTSFGISTLAGGICIIIVIILYAFLQLLGKDPRLLAVILSYFERITLKGFWTVGGYPEVLFERITLKGFRTVGGYP